MMKVIHVCVGKTKDLEIRGQAVKTAYLKSAVSGPVSVNDYGIEGNDVAVQIRRWPCMSKAHKPERLVVC